MIRWGIIGAGDIANTKVIPAIKATRQAELVHVMARREERAARMAAKHDAARHSTQPESVWADRDVDAVYIATPPHLHAEQTVSALQAGKHVLCEKPMAMSEAEGQAMIEAAEAASKKLAIAHQMRFHNSYRRARELLAQNLIGRINVIQIDHLTSMPAWFGDAFSVDQYRFDRIYGGGAIMDMGVHDFDGVRFMLQREIIEVFALGGPISFPCDVDDSAVILFQMQGSVLGTLGLSFDTPGGDSIVRFHGSQGTLVVKQKAQANCGQLRVWLDGAWKEYEIEPQNPYEAEISHFIKSIQGEEQLVIDAMEGLRSLRVTLACYASLRNHQPIIV
jgi:1,5-anhydro-D-fructose reductase (1,5-anhydro-D-mannitol-forming)